MSNPWDSLSLENRAELYSHTQQWEYADIVSRLSWAQLTRDEQEAIFRTIFLMGRNRERA